MKTRTIASDSLSRSVKLAGLLLAAAALALTARAETDVTVEPTADPTFSELPPAIPLWTGYAPGSEGQDTPLKKYWEHYTFPSGATTWYPVITNINTPAIIPFIPPQGRGTGTAVVVCPGGGHRDLAMEHEGYAVGRWLSEHGVAAFILEYRLEKAPGSTYKADFHSTMDVQRAIRTVRSRAAEWRIDPHRVGVMGFSAGGAIAAFAATKFAAPVKGTSDAVDALDCRPDFQALIYPGLPKEELPISAATPPAFLCAASDDGFHLQTPMVQYYLKLSAAGVQAELHVYAEGGHGFGIRDLDKPVYSWMGLFNTWLGVVAKEPAK